MCLHELVLNVSGAGPISDAGSSSSRKQLLSSFRVLSFFEQVAHDYLSQPLRLLKRHHLPSHLLMHPAVIADDDLIVMTEDDLRDILKSTLRDERRLLLEAFERADIVGVIRMTGWSYRRAWAEFKAHMSEGRIRAIKPQLPAAAGDILCINECFVDQLDQSRRRMGRWFCRVVQIEGYFARLEILETSDVPWDIEGARRADPRLLTSWLEGTHPDFKVERLRRPGEGSVRRKDARRRTLS